MLFERTIAFQLFTANRSKVFDDHSPVHREPFANFKFFLAVHPFTASCSKFFVGRSAIQRKLFEFFLWPISCSPQAVRNFSLAVQPLTASRLKFFFGRSAVHGNRFKWLGHPFFIRSEAVRFAVERISVSVRFCVRGHNYILASPRGAACTLEMYISARESFFTTDFYPP